MASVSAISSGSRTSAATAEDDTLNPARIPQKQLGQNDFLKLLATQFSKQDPMKPMEDTAFIAQMAQFSSLEQSSAMSSTMTAMRADQQRATANSYLGHRVTVDDGKGGTVTDDVTAVDVSGTEPRLIVGAKSFSISSVLRVEPGLVSAPAPQPATTGGA
jgi:flagellar basal-body rod modification protein FlgD